MDISLLQTLTEFAGSTFWVGFLFTLIYTLAPGPINAVVVKQTLEYGVLTGGRIAIGNILGDGTAIFLGGLPFMFGITWLADFLEINFSLAMTAVAILLLVIGIHMIHIAKKQNSGTNQLEEEGYRYRHTLWAYLYTAFHPGSLLSTATLVATLQASQLMTTSNDMLMLMLGFTLGCAVAWTIFLAMLGKVRKKASAGLIRRISIAVGGFIVFLALLIILQNFLAI